MSDFDVTVVELRVAAHSLRTLESDARADLTTLAGRVDDLTNGTWSGAASTGFAGEFAQWRAGALEGLSALELMCDALETSATGYAASDVGSADTFTATGGGL